MAVDWSEFAGSFTALFGESVIYTPYGGAARTISAIVDRQPRSVLAEANQVLRPKFVVHAKNHATEGVSMAALDRARDTVAFPEIPGGTPATWSILRVTTQDEGMIALECA